MLSLDLRKELTTSSPSGVCSVCGLVRNVCVDICFCLLHYIVDLHLKWKFFALERRVEREDPRKKRTDGRILLSERRVLVFCFVVFVLYCLYCVCQVFKSQSCVYTSFVRVCKLSCICIPVRFCLQVIIILTGCLYTV